MGEWLMSLPDGLEAFVLVALSIIGLGVLTAVILSILRGAGVRIGKEGLEIDPATGQPSRKKSPHIRCRHVDEIIDVMHRVMDCDFKVYEVKYIETIRDQMSLVEAKALLVRGVMERVFLDHLSRKLKRDGTEDEVITHRDFKVYSLCLDELLQEARDFLKTSLRENHYAEMDEITFDRYSEEKIDMVSHLATTFLNSAYFGDVLSRGEIYKANMEFAVPEIKKHLYDLLLNARRIAKDKVAVVANLIAERDKYVSGVLGVGLGAESP